MMWLSSRPSKADTYGNRQVQTDSAAPPTATCALPPICVIAEVEELVEPGELGPGRHRRARAPVVDMIYVRKGEKKPFCPMWQRASQAEAKAREAAEGAQVMGASHWTCV